MSFSFLGQNAGQLAHKVSRLALSPVLFWFPCLSGFCALQLAGSSAFLLSALVLTRFVLLFLRHVGMQARKSEKEKK